MWTGLGPTPALWQALPQNGWSPKNGVMKVGQPAISPAAVVPAPPMVDHCRAPVSAKSPQSLAVKMQQHQSNLQSHKSAVFPSDATSTVVEPEERSVATSKVQGLPGKLETEVVILSLTVSQEDNKEPPKQGDSLEQVSPLLCQQQFVVPKAWYQQAVSWSSPWKQPIMRAVVQ